MWQLIVIVSICTHINSASCSIDEIDGNRIVNGTDAEDGEFPYIVSLRRSSSGSHSCGGSIINENWILTAAHCVAKKDPKQINIQYGVRKISANGPNIAKISKIIAHERYNPQDNYINDIALLRLEEKIHFNDRIQPVKLPAQKQKTPERSPAVLIGWGLEMSGGNIQTNLQKVNLITFSDEECQTRHQGRPHISNICAGIPEGGKGQCSGDSGGPLTVNHEQVGIVSWSIKPCAVAPYPGVFTKVSYYIDWIKHNIEQEY